MSDELIISSTTDTPEQMQAALDHGVKPPSDEVLSTEGADDEKPPVEEKATEEAVEEKDDKPPVEKKDEDEKPPQKAKVDEKDEDGELGARAKKRIARLVAEREEQRRRADAAEARAKEVEDAKKPASDDKKSEDVAPDAEWKTANPEPKQDDFEDYESFAKVWTTWEVGRQRHITVTEAEKAGAAAAAKTLADHAAKEQSDKEAAESTERFQRFEETREEAKGRYEDFETVIAGAKDMPLSPEMQFVIMDSPVGHDVAYWLATHPDEAAELSELKGAAAAREMGRLERTIELQVEGGKPQIENEKPVKKAAATKTPAPIEPVGGRSVVATTDLSEMSYQDFKTIRNRSEEARRNRR